MNHCLVLPNELIIKLTQAFSDSAIRNTWTNIGVNSVDEMISKIVKSLNEKYPKLSIIMTRIEDKDIIKERVENLGTVSYFTGYFENEKGNVDALFFYIEPKMDSANDLLTRQVVPVILGIYKSIKDRTHDLHINSMPVFIVSLCTTRRITQDSVKKTIVCAESMGFNYLDIFDNDHLSVIDQIDANGNPVMKIRTIQAMDVFLRYNGTNEYFEVDTNKREVRILSNKLAHSSNITAELYRYALRIIPAVYMASNEGYTIDSTSLNGLASDRVEILREYISRF